MISSGVPPWIFFGKFFKVAHGMSWNVSNISSWDDSPAFFSVFFLISPKRPPGVCRKISPESLPIYLRVVLARNFVGCPGGLLRKTPG